ncbi:MAG: IS200/IS605 family element transposase accessory protein TnpB [Ardenticatenales bacterium]|nr:IS200/IS605 family element transposase accessory protein TnpB [Ardenticatenales bacterium]
MASQFLTCAFKLHNPSAWRRAVLDHICEEYTYAMRDLLAGCEESGIVLKDAARKANKQGEKQNKWTGDSVACVLPRSGELQVDVVSTLKEAMISNVAAMLASHYALETIGQAGFPTARDPSPEGLMEAENDLALVGEDLADYERARNNVTRRSRGDVMPVHIIRSRDVRILADTERGRFFAWFRTLPVNHPLGHKTIIDQGNLVDVNTGAPFAYAGDGAILLPLEVGVRQGEWHWQYTKFLQPILQGQASIKSAQLIRKGLAGKREYFLNVAFEFDCPKPYEPESYLGIDRGILYTVAYAVVDKRGAILLKEHQEDGLRALQIAAGKYIRGRQRRGKPVNVTHYRGKQREEVLHKLANRIIAVALECQAGIVLEDLNIQVRGKFVKSSWAKLESILIYKCTLAGVPFVCRVFAAKSSQICIWCGELVERQDRVLTCHHCGAIEHSDDAAGVNIARRAMYRKKDWEKQGGYRAFHRSFANVR